MVVAPLPVAAVLTLTARRRTRGAADDYAQLLEAATRLQAAQVTLPPGRAPGPAPDAGPPR